MKNQYKAVKDIYTTRAQLINRATHAKSSRAQLKQVLEAFKLSLPIAILTPALVHALEVAKYVLEVSDLKLVYARQLLVNIAHYTRKLA